MDITSYLLGKKSSGGGGGSGGLDWTAIGYNEMPSPIQEDYNYALQIKNNWIPNANLNNAFKSDFNLVYMPLVDTSTASIVTYMFDGCSYLITIPALTITNKVTSLGYMFQNCSALREVDLSSFDVSKVTSMKNTFYKCSRLKELDLSTWQTSSLTAMNNTFEGCTSLQKLDIRNFNFTNVSNYNATFTGIPVNCLIIVHDETAKNWVLARRSDFTNVKTIDEYNAM